MERFQDFARNVLTGGPAAGAAITVYLQGTLTLAAIFSDNLGTPTALANPTTAASLTGYFRFYAADGRYDVLVTPTGGGTPYTLADVLLDDPA
jgi:hypothetical protein